MEKKYMILKFLDTIVKYNIDVFIVFTTISLFYILNFKSVAEHTYLLLFANILLISSIYFLNKVSDKNEDVLNSTNINKGREKLIFGYYILANILSFSIYAFINYWFLFFWFIFFILGFLYSYPKKYRLKNIFILKNLVPSFCWYLAFNTLIFLNFPDANWIYLLVVGWSTLMILFVFEIFWDLPDINGDKNSGVKTFPTEIGFEKAKLVILLLNTFIFVFINSIVIQCVVFIISIFLLFAKKNTNKVYYHLVIMAITILYLFLLFLKWLY